ncbi:MAG TPA: glycerate kinase, partial [Candidatus Eremiobacteraceae bacterium]|nr:glycerate kinase [Candidatus Eremiobacteraceae bacterium]
LARATLRPGAQLVLEVLDFERHLGGANLVVTGEGRLDRQTMAGKAPYAVALAARARGIPVVAIAGSVDCPPEYLEAASIAFAVPIVSGPMTVEEAMDRAADLAADAAEMLGRALALGWQLGRGE